MKYHGQAGVHGHTVVGGVVWVLHKDIVHVSVKETALTGKTVIYNKKIINYS